MDDCPHTKALNRSKFDLKLYINSSLVKPEPKSGGSGLCTNEKFQLKRKRGEVTEFEARIGRVTERDVFAGGAEVNEFAVC